MAPSVLYVTDCSSGATVAYGIPFGPQQGVAAGASLPLLPLDLAQPRGGGLQPPGAGRGRVAAMTLSEAKQEIVVTVNGEPHRLVEGGTAHDLLVAIGLDGRPVAVEVNEVVVPRASLPECVLRQDDQLEIVTLVGGG